MKPLSLLSKYLLITAAVCAAAVGLTAFTLYLMFQGSLDEALQTSAQVYQARMLDNVRRHAIDTTAALAERLASERDRGPAAPQIIERAIKLDGASLIVVLAADGSVLASTGNSGFQGLVAAIPDGETRSVSGSIVSRAAIAGGGSVGQVFDASVRAGEVAVIRELMAGVVSRLGGETLRSGVAISLGAIAVAGLVLVAFAVRQIGDLQRLTAGAARMSAGNYGEGVGVERADELGQLARALDELRERLRTTTISRDYLDHILGSMNEALILVSSTGQIRRANNAAARLLERDAAAVNGQHVAELLAPESRAEFALADSGGRVQENTIVTAGGQEVPISFTITEIVDNDPNYAGFVIAARNIAERKAAEQRIRYLARIDALTKVPNRMQFQHLMQRAVARASRQGQHFALLYIDVDGFKDINDIYGHSAGDHCLEALTERLSRLLPERTILGRFAGDEFGVLIEDTPAAGDGSVQLANTARSILGRIAEPLAYHGQQVHMTVSIGIAVFPVDARNVIDLIRCADSALYHAKRSGGNAFEFFDPDMNAKAAERLMLKSKLRRSFERNELLLEYQPKVELSTGRIAGAEALVRWDLSDRGIILPAEFIPLAEETNLILDIGEWVLDRVCRDFHGWQAQMVFPGKIAVNLSLKQLRLPNFPQRVSTIFRRHGVPPGSLELEITESTLMENPERTVRILDELYNMGLSLAIDDFGTGYSSLSALQKFPITTLKIDRSFVVNAASDADDATIVSTIVQMGHGLNLDVIAEGVESPRQLQFLREVGCDYVQGLVFGGPMGADDFLRLLLAQRQGEPAYRAIVESSAQGRVRAAP
jgi:diguanylate cyclase (GGDEF)-like protein/PAS domain S-box-containing protein